MKLYVTYTSPYARLARIVVIEKELADTVSIIEAKTRIANSDYYTVNPSGRVPYLVNDDGIGMEDSQLICSYLDFLDGKPLLHHPHHQTDLNYCRFEASARSMCDWHIGLGARNAPATERAVACRTFARGREKPAHGRFV